MQIFSNLTPQINQHPTLSCKKNSINNYYTNLNELKQDTVSFSGNFVSPKVTNELEKTVLDKILRYANLLPENSKITKPVITKINDETVGFTIDKTNMDKIKLTIKDKMDIEDAWENAPDKQSSFLGLFDRNGQMFVGRVHKKGEFECFIQCINFERRGKNIRRLKIGHGEYIPSRQNDSWIYSEAGSTHESGAEAYPDFEDVNFYETFMELAKLKTSLFAKK